MSDWQRKLELQPEWDQAKAGAISRQALARVIAERLKALQPFEVPARDANNEHQVNMLEWINEKRDELAWIFEDCAGNSDLSVEDFDDAMENLYDWADSPVEMRGENVVRGKKVCWISTF